MQRFHFALILVFALYVHSLAAEVLVMDLRSYPAAKAYCEKNQNCRVIESKTKEFSNDNTFVQFGDSVTNQSFRLILPAQLTGNDLMEALIKVRTARVQNAKDIGVVVDGNIEMNELVADYFRVAGAQWIQTDKQKTDLLNKRTSKKVLSAKSKLVSAVVNVDHPDLSVNLGNRLKLPVWSLEQLHDLKDEKGDNGFQLIMVSSVAPPVNENLFKTLNEVYRAKARGHKVLLVTPYFPYARSDKMDQPGVTVTGRLVADLMETAGVDVASFTRLHAPQAQGFFQVPTVHVSGRETITQFLNDYHIDAVISPDAGFQKDATLYADDLKVPVYVINKQRNPATGESELKAMGEFNLSGLRLAVIDDETASGSTLGSAAEFLKSKGARSVLGVVTHLAGKADKALENKALDMVVVTNTFPVSVKESERFKVLSIGEEMAKHLAPFVMSDQPCDPYLKEEQR